MNKMFLSALVMLCLACAIGCKGKKDMSGNEEVSVSDFIDFFTDVKLPITLTDSSLKKKPNDSALISNTVFNQFIGDTIFDNLYGKEKPKIYALGKFKNEEAETYLILGAKGTKINSFYVVAFAPDTDKYSAHMLLLSNSPKANEVNKTIIDSRYTFTQIDQYKEADGSTSEYTSVHAYNNAGLFMVIMSNGLKKGEQMAIINPIDTLPATHKHSGNYGKDKRNFITIRDGKTPEDFVFFLYFDRGNGSECQGELKGEAVFEGKDSATYKSPTDPCTIGFKFTSNGVRFNESVNCGNKRPSDCSFNASYTKLKNVTEKKVAKEKKNDEKTNPKEKVADKKVTPKKS
jgi:hypothetical protein